MPPARAAESSSMLSTPSDSGRLEGRASIRPSRLDLGLALGMLVVKKKGPSLSHEGSKVMIPGLGLGLQERESRLSHTIGAADEGGVHPVQKPFAT